MNRHFAQHSDPSFQMSCFRNGIPGVVTRQILQPGLTFSKVKDTAAGRLCFASLFTINITLYDMSLNRSDSRTQYNRCAETPSIFSTNETKSLLTIPLCSDVARDWKQQCYLQFDSVIGIEQRHR